MAEIDRRLNAHPDPHKVAELAELRIRNLLCFEELQAYNNTGKLKYKHPLIKQHSQRCKLQDLLRDNQQAFLEEYKNVANNVARYQSFLRRPKISPADKDKWQKQLEKHQETLDIITDLLKQMRHG